MKNITAWYELDRAAQSEGFYQFTMAAEENANETIHIEKAATEDQLAELCFSSLEGLLCDSDDEAARVWFKTRGVRW
jgi:hypothetical protein